MSTPTKARSKRALPNVPLERAANTDRIVTGTPKPRAISKRLDGEHSSVDAKKNRRSASQRQLQSKDGPNMNSKLRSEMSSRRKDLSSSDSGSNASSPYDSPREIRKATVAPMVAQIIDKFSSGSQETSSLGMKDGREESLNTEKKIARVLPMTPQFLEEHMIMPANDEPLSTKKAVESIDNLKIADLQSNIDEVKGSFTPSWNKNALDVIQSNLTGTPSRIMTTPQQPLVDDAEGSSVRVGVRVRPLLPREENDPNVKQCISMKDNKTVITSDSGMEYEFIYDHSIWSCDPKHPEFVGQEKLYELIGQPLLNSAFEGYNTCLFAYGQTGSGKSYSIMGQGDERGILPRFCEELFERIKCWKELQFTVEISYFEIYNEKIHDLLAPSKKKDNKKVQLRVREHPILGPFVQDLSTYTASSYADVESWLAVGNSIRATAATGMNDKSSRSHSVFTLVMTQTKTEIFEDSETQMTTTSKINLIDLAGSERASQVLNDQVIKTAETAALRLKEGGSINKSLHTLGKVISLLSDREASTKKKMYIPYRDSTLTWLLKDSLGGNAKTTMIANISPASTSFGESLSTLRYAQRARTIVNRAIINEDPNARIIRELKAEIERLKLFQGEGNQEISAKALAEVALLREKLKETQHLLAESTRNWQEKLALTEKRKLEEAEKLKKSGISFKVDNRLPNLVNLNEDPQLSEMLLYMLKEGETTVGQKDHDIKLSGALVAETHCVLRNDGDKVTVSPIGDAPTYVNGQLIAEETVLHHADRVVIGGDHFFRLNHPIEVKKRKKGSESTATEAGTPEAAVVKDYEFARNELAQAQDARLQAELEEAREEARIKAQEEIVVRIQEAKEAAQQELTLQKQHYEEKVTHLSEAMESLTTEKKEAEQSKQTAVEKISELEAHRMLLEQEILNNRKKLQMEALAAKQALEETKMNQVRIITELEKEKKKMQEDVLKLKEAKQTREKVREEFRASFNNIGRKNSLADDPNKRELLRITMSLREANKISQSLGKHVTFSRDDVLIDGKSEMKIRLNNTKKGLTTLWSLEKFESAMEQMRELYQHRDNDSVSEESGDEVDPFNDPDDKWEKDFKLDSPSSRRITSISSSAGLPSRTRSSSASKTQGFSGSKAESIFAKYRNQQNQGTSSDVPVVPSGQSSDVGALPERPVEVASSRPPVAPASRRKSETRRPSQNFAEDTPGPSLPSFCRESLNNYLESLKELSDLFDEPVYEKILRSVKDIKSSVTAIKKAAADGGSSKEVHQCCLTATLSLQLLIEHARIWGTTETPNPQFTELSSQLIDAVKRLADHVIKIVQALDGSTSNVDNLFTAFTDDVRHVVRHTAKMAVVSSVEVQLTDGDNSSVDDGELNKAFVEGQDMSMEISVRDSISAILEIQEQLQTDALASYNTGVEREISDHVLALIRTTGDFIHQGREVQMQLISTSNENDRKKDTGRSRLISVKTFVSSVQTLLQRTRELASNIRIACEDMDFEKLVSLPEEIVSSVSNIVRQKQAFIEAEYAACVGNNQNILDEMEYLEKKCSDVELAAGDLRKTLTRFLFLSPPKSLQKKHACRVFRTCDERCNCGDCSPFTGRSIEPGTPLSSRSRDILSEQETRNIRKLWSKESPI